MPMPIKSAVAACAIALAVTAAEQSPAAAETLPEACARGPYVVRNGIPYARQCVTWTYAYGRNRCTRWMPVMCGGGGTGNR
jgi:hypothetical protein